MTRKAKLSLADVYARIPEVDCKGLCQESCGPIAMSHDEDHRLQELGVSIPPMVDGVAAIERGEEFWCPALQDGRCNVYDDRPTICRLWGATTSMPCPHGCTSHNALSQRMSFELLALAGRVGGGMASGLANSEEEDSADDHRGPDEHHGDGHDGERRRLLGRYRRALHFRQG